MVHVFKLGGSAGEKGGGGSGGGADGLASPPDFQDGASMHSVG